MKVRYSDKIREIASWEIIQECIQLTYSVVTTEGMHIFQLRMEKDELRIRHNVPQINYEREIAHHTKVILDDIVDIVIYKNKKYIYILTVTELFAKND